MRLPRASAVTAPSRKSGLVRADVGAMTRTSTAEFQAIERAGGTLQNVANLGFQSYMRRQAIDDIAEAGKATQHIQESWSQASKTVATMDTSLDQPLPNDPAYHKSLLAITKDKSIELRDELTKDIEKDAAKVFSGIRNARTKARLIAQYNENYAANLQELDGVITRRLHAYQLDTMQKLGNAAALNGDLETADFYADKMAEHGLITPSAATKLKKAYEETSIRETVTGLYRIGLHDEAKKVLEASSLSNEDKEKLEDVIDKDEISVVNDFENGINDVLVQIDNTPDMTQAEFNAAAEVQKQKILAFDKIDGTDRKRLLAGLERWRRGTNEIDYAKILSLNQEMDAAQRSGIVDPTIKNRITEANLDGSFGGRNKGGVRTYGDMIRRFEKLSFDERVQGITPIIQTFERENADDPRLIFLFQQARNKVLAENPDIDSRELFVKISGLAETYSILPEAVIKSKLKSKTILMLSPDGKQFNVPLSKKQKFLDNGYTVR